MLNKIFKKRGPKVFCIGFGKTGTTSVEKALKDLGFKPGDQGKAELLIHDWKDRKFQSIVDYCNSAEAFQDIPFCLPFTFIPLDIAFPGSKFILTVRNSPEEWYHSLVGFHSKVHGNGKIPTANDLKKAPYRYKGFAWDVRNAVWDVPEDDVYNREIMVDSYIRHVEDVKEYFRHRPDDLLILNVSKKGAYRKLCRFLKKEPLYEEFPWENKTSDI